MVLCVQAVAASAQYLHRTVHSGLHRSTVLYCTEAVTADPRGPGEAPGEGVGCTLVRWTPSFIQDTGCVCF